MIWKSPGVLILIILSFYVFNVLAGWMWMGLGFTGICLSAWAYFDKGPFKTRLKTLAIGLVLIGASAGMSALSFFSSKRFWFIVAAVGISLCIYAFRGRWLSRTARTKYFTGGTTMASLAMYFSGMYATVTVQCVNTYALALQQYVKLQGKVSYILSAMGIG